MQRLDSGCDMRVTVLSGTAWIAEAGRGNKHETQLRFLTTACLILQQIQVKYPKSKEYFRKLEYAPEPYDDVLKNGGAKKMGFGTGELHNTVVTSATRMTQRNDAKAQQRGDPQANTLTPLQVSLYRATT